MKILYFLLLLAIILIAVPSVVCIAVNEFKQSLKGHIDWRFNNILDQSKYNESQLNAIHIRLDDLCHQTMRELDLIKEFYTKALSGTVDAEKLIDFIESNTRQERGVEK